MKALDRDTDFIGTDRKYLFNNRSGCILCRKAGFKVQRLAINPFPFMSGCLRKTGQATR